MSKKTEQERDIGLSYTTPSIKHNTIRLRGQEANLDTSDAELNQGAEHFTSGNLISGTSDRHLHEQAVVMWLFRQGHRQHLDIQQI